jgi:hypothetical protein
MRRDADGTIRPTPVEGAILFFDKLRQWGADIEVDANYVIHVNLSNIGPHPFDDLDELREYIEYFRGPMEALWCRDQTAH